MLNPKLLYNFYLMCMAVCRMAAFASEGTPTTKRITRGNTGRTERDYFFNVTLTN
jgi:hypothetical protein